MEKVSNVQITTLRTIDDSVMLAVPPALLDALHLTAGAQVRLIVDGRGRLVVEPADRPSLTYTLAELMAECDATADISEEKRLWLDAKPVGKELW